MAIFTGTAFVTLLGRSLIVGAGAGTFFGFAAGTEKAIKVFAVVSSAALAIQLLRSK